MHYLSIITISKPKAKARIPRKREPDIYNIAALNLLVWDRFRLSYINVENVVKAPRKPSPNRRYLFVPASELTRIPRSSAPKTFIINVPKGKAEFDFRVIISPSKYLEAAPSAPPKPTSKYCNQSTSLSKLSSVSFVLGARFLLKVRAVR